MERLERELREVLGSDRLALPGHAVDLDRVHAGARRRRRRRAAASVVSVAVLVAAVVAGAGLLQADHRAAPTPATSDSATPSPSGSATPAPPALGPAWGDAQVLSVTATTRRTFVVLGALGGGAGCPASSCVRLAETRDGGATFRSLPVPDAVTGDPATGPNGRSVSGVRFGSPQDGWLFGGGVWSTHDGGSTWQHVDLPATVRSLEAAGGTAWALVGGPNDVQRLYSSPVGEDDWQPVKDVSVAGPAALAVQGDRVTVLGAEGSAAWSNAGGGFREVKNPCDAALDVRLSASFVRLWATCVTGTAAFLATSRDGTAWTTVPVDTGQGALPNSVVVGARTSSEAVAWLGNGDVALARVAADGTVTPLPDIGTGVSWLGFTDLQVGYAVTCCSVRGLQRTDDGGQSWRVLDLTTARHE